MKNSNAFTKVFYLFMLFLIASIKMNGQCNTSPPQCNLILNSSFDELNETAPNGAGQISHSCMWGQPPFNSGGPTPSPNLFYHGGSINYSVPTNIAWSHN